MKLNWRHTTTSLLCAATVTLSSIGVAQSCGGAIGNANPNACDPPEMCIPGCSGCPQQTSGDIGGTPCPKLGEHKDGYVCHSTIAGQFWGY